MASLSKRFQGRRIDSKYSVCHTIGKGEFGAVCIGIDENTGAEVAMKLVSRSKDVSSLKEESDQYEKLSGVPGFPETYLYSAIAEYDVMIYELLGPNIEDMFEFCSGNFTPKMILLLMDQLLLRFEALHSKGLLHRNVKPQNCLMGTGENRNIVYLTDFGLSEKAGTWVEGEDGYHLTEKPRVIGKTHYSSVRAHLGEEQSQRDDLESLGYRMIYLARGKLPWEELEASDDSEKVRRVVEVKRTIANHVLCNGLPGEPRGFRAYMRYVRSLEHDEMPDYEKLRGIFRTAIEEQGITDYNIFGGIIRTAKAKSQPNAVGVQSTSAVIDLT